MLCLFGFVIFNRVVSSHVMSCCVITLSYDVTDEMVTKYCRKVQHKLELQTRKQSRE